MPEEAFVKYSHTSRESTLCRIIPFPQKMGMGSVPRTDSSGLIGAQDQKSKEEIEAMLYEILIKEKLLRGEQDINPFGPVYLCDLKPDEIDHARIERIKMFAAIEDLSDSISFNDGMDD
jgi:hypothetical protein